MAGTVWVSSWQLQCCGEPIDVGAWVDWHVVPPDTAWLTDLLGADLAATVVGAEEHHDRLEEATELSGRVRTIRVVSHELEQRPDGLYPVAGSAVLTEVERADGQWDGPANLSGYLVEVAP